MEAVLLSVYFTCLFQFSFISHPIVYCMLLLGCCLRGVGFCYTVTGFCWYVIILCLVYIGGVYILFIFVSVHKPNPNSFSGGSLGVFIPLYFVCYWFFSYFDVSYVSYVEKRHYLCTLFEGFSYCLLCLVLLLGFIIISVVSSSKDSFYR